MSTSRTSLLEQVITIVGVGLIGGSIAAAIRQRHSAQRVIGVGRNASRLEAARSAGIIDVGMTSLEQAASESSLVIVCTPVDRIVADVCEAAAVMKPGSLITDAGSVKGPICEALRDLATGPVTFLGSHPLAGSEKQGFEFASPTLFDHKLCVLTPWSNTPPEQVQRTHQFWQTLGMKTCELSPEVHDLALANASHLPHLLAAALVISLPEDQRKFAATGFRDTTRIAAGDPELWTAIFLQNTGPLLKSMETLSDKFQAFRRAIEQRDAVTLKKLLQQAKTGRDALD